MEVLLRRNRVAVNNLQLYERLVTCISQQTLQQKIRPSTNVPVRKNKYQKPQQQRFQQRNTLKKLFNSSAGFNSVRTPTQKVKIQIPNRRNAKMNAWQDYKPQKRALTQENKKLLGSQRKFFMTNDFKMTSSAQKQNLMSKTFTVSRKKKNFMQKSVKQDIQQMGNFKADFAPFMSISNFYKNKQDAQKKRGDEKLHRYNRRKFERIWGRHNFSRLFKHSNSKQKVDQFNKTLEIR